MISHLPVKERSQGTPKVEPLGQAYGTFQYARGAES